MSWDAVDPEDADEWATVLRNLDLAVNSAGTIASTIDGMLIFGENPGRFLPQSGVRAICYTGQEPEYATRADEQLRGALVPLRALDGSLVETGLVDRVWDFVRRNTTPTATLRGARRVDRWEYPEEVIREIVVNALIHRDYSIAGTDIAVSIFTDRLEVQSPGRLPNTVTVDSMRLGMRYSRNQTLVNVMRDYGYMEARGMGIRNKVIPLMRDHNGTNPDLIEGGPPLHRSTVEPASDPIGQSGSRVGVSDLRPAAAGLSPGDLLFARCRATAGEAYLYRPRDGPSVYAECLIRFRAISGVAVPEFLDLWTRSPFYHKWGINAPYGGSAKHE